LRHHLQTDPGYDDDSFPAAEAGRPLYYLTELYIAAHYLQAGKICQEIMDVLERRLQDSDINFAMLVVTNVCQKIAPPTPLRSWFMEQFIAPGLTRIDEPVEVSRA
jgi:hypothetical protein